MTYQDVLDFWFVEIDQEMWFKKSDEFDQLLTEKFTKMFTEVSKGEHYKWRSSAKGRLAEILILDQFSRNIFRGSALSFQFDAMALTLAQEAISLGFDQQLKAPERGFMYMPYMHSESSIVHKEAVRLFTDYGVVEQLKYEQLHFDIIKRFGRYPHRNEILGRESTIEEIKFLKQKGSSF